MNATRQTNPEITKEKKEDTQQVQSLNGKQNAKDL